MSMITTWNNGEIPLKKASSKLNLKTNGCNSADDPHPNFTHFSMGAYTLVGLYTRKYGSYLLNLELQKVVFD